ncbi:MULTISPECIES: glucoamylase family protein [unclassified Sphingomonas]|uniref:glucoamylase family protein n=1 Tax=unclassified Sphingomonas TaxID=196159 RepID=UPI0006F424E3|nr:MULTISPECIES: glucoamylase family protein [unclassified Sphingomonas]KQM28858.1 Tat pathway signal protein [Sphingomonas sp. Leaf9]KQM45559.1 Tat pathway signal protein [Sphingomonas sp. Leaf11]
MIDRRFFLAASTAALVGACTPRTGIAPTPARNPDLFSDIQERAFRFFWDTTDAATGLAPDRWPTPSFASIAAIGFALTAYGVGEKHGWITRQQHAERTLTTLQFLADAPQGDGATGFSGYKGFFYHFLGVTKGQRFARCELSTIDTALLLGGVLFAQSWFDRADPNEVRIRALAEQLYRAVEWDWIMPRPPFVSMGWHPESGFIRSDWNIYNEGMILYVLALASPTHPLPPATWGALTQQFDKSWGNRWGEPHLQFAPMFGHQYSHVWIDFRGIRDPYIASKGIDYFENSRRATYAQRAYANENPGGKVAYGNDCWGLTACDGPGDFTVTIDGKPREFYSYSARGPGERDDGTLAPTAALGSIAFAPEIVEPMVKTMHARYGAGIYDKYGFLDSFNPTLTRTDEPLKHGKLVPGVGWVDGDYLGIDQGPIVLMIENRRSGMIWEVMRRNPHIRRGLERAGFKGGWLA